MPGFIISRLEPQKRRKGWFEIEIKDKPSFLIDEETIVKNSLKEGVIISDDVFLKIKYESDFAWLKFKAMGVISRRMISERDLRRKLSAEKKPSETRDETISLLKHYGYIDDAIFAAAYIRSQMSQGPKSQLYLKKKLWEKGISAELTDAAIEAELGAVDMNSMVKELAQKKMKSLGNYSPEKARARLINFLRGKGFSWDVIKNALADLIVKDMMKDDSEID